MFVNVVTCDMTKMEQTAQRRVDYSTAEGRVWISKHIMWAVNNGHGVQIVNEEDEKDAT